MNILFLSLYEPSETGSGNQKVTVLSSRYLSNVDVRCYIAYIYDSKSTSSSTYFVKKIKIDYNSIECFRSFLIENKIDIIHNQAARTVNMKFLKKAVWGLNVRIVSVFHNFPGSEIIRYSRTSLWFHITKRKISAKWGLYLLLYSFYPATNFFIKKYTEKKYRAIHDNSDCLVLLSDNYIPIYCKLSKINKTNKIVVIPNYLSYEYKKYSMTKKIKEVLIVARFDEISKRILLALEIWKYLISNYDLKDWNLTIVGYGEWRNIYEDFIKKNNIVNIKLVGRDESKKYYERASILMFTSLLEGAPLSLLEAMQMGVVPVAFNDCLAIKDLLHNNYNSKVVKAPNIHEYAKSIYDLITDENMRNNLSLNAFDSIQFFSIEKIMKKWINLYKNII